MTQEQQSRLPVADFDQDQHMDRSFDHVARVREAKEAAQREMESFGDVSEYDIATIQGLKIEDLKKEEEPQGERQRLLDFKDAEQPALREAE